MLEIKNAVVVVVRILFFLTIMVCVGDWQIQIIFRQRNQYPCPECSYANNDVFMHAPRTFVTVHAVWKGLLQLAQIY